MFTFHWAFPKIATKLHFSALVEIDRNRGQAHAKPPSKKNLRSSTHQLSNLHVDFFILHIFLDSSRLRPGLLLFGIESIRKFHWWCQHKVYEYRTQLMPSDENDKVLYLGIRSKWNGKPCYQSLHLVLKNCKKLILQTEKRLQNINILKSSSFSTDICIHERQSCFRL